MFKDKFGDKLVDKMTPGVNVKGLFELSCILVLTPTFNAMVGYRPASLQVLFFTFIADCALLI